MTKHKAHKKSKGGKKRKRTIQKKRGDFKERNPKAYGVHSAVAAKKRLARASDLDQNRYHAPLLDKALSNPAPYVILVHGPRNVGKTTLIRCLVRHFTRQTLSNVEGPLTVVAGKQRRLTFVECPHDLNGMIDCAKFADVVLLLIDASFGFELETFEFLNLLQVHGFPKVMGVLTHLDVFPTLTLRTKAKRKLKTRFESEVNKAARLFSFSGFRNRKYLHHEVKNLGRFLSAMKIRPLSWRTEHPYVLIDRFEDMTPETKTKQDPLCDRDVQLYGYLRGTNFRPGSKVHISGVGDYEIHRVEGLTDPCPLPNSIVQKSLKEKERQIYAPMNDLDGFVIDKDAIYVEIPDWKMYASGETGENAEATEGDRMIRQLQSLDVTLDEKLEKTKEKLFEKGPDGDDASNDLDPFEVASSEEDEKEDENPFTKKLRKLPRYERVEDSGRIRKRVVFDKEDPASFSDKHCAKSDDESNPEADLEDDVERNSNEELSEVVSEDERSEKNTSRSHKSDQLHISENKWKDQLMKRAEERFKDLSTPLQDFIYQSSLSSSPSPFLRSLPIHGGSSSRMPMDVSLIEKWSQPLNTAQFRNRFTTGDWDEGKKRADALPSGSDSEAFGEFEDLETGECFAGELSDPVTQFAQSAIKKAAAYEQSQRLEEKRKRKRAFDEQYDAAGGGKEMDEMAETKAPYVSEFRKDRSQPSFYSAVKEDLEQKITKTRQAVDALDPRQRILLEGFRPGTYIKMLFEGMPCEFVQSFSKSRPILVGGLDPIDVKQGCMRLRIKRHRWFPKILKTKDPLVFSMGWRRFQGLPIYCTEDHNRRLRYLKYTPEHAHCQGVVWGPLCPVNTSFAAFQNLASNLEGWRISATGTATEIDADVRIVKKLKLLGTPIKIEKTTSFITGMFNSPLEVARFEGASIRTVSGIRGTIKKGVKDFEGGGPGTFRASFEDRLVQSDIVFLRAWVAVDIPRFSLPVTNLLFSPSIDSRQHLEGTLRSNQGQKHLPQNDSRSVLVKGNRNKEIANFIPTSRFEGKQTGYIFKTSIHGLGYYRDETQSEAGDTEACRESEWPSMRTVAEIRRSQNTGAPQIPDSYYKSFQRAPRQFPSLKLPSKLIATLPYDLKPKPKERQRHSEDLLLTAVPEKHEIKANEMLHQLKTVHQKKMDKRKLQRARQILRLQRQQKADQKRREAFNKEERKKRYREDAFRQSRKTTSRKRQGYRGDTFRQRQEMKDKKHKG